MGRTFNHRLRVRYGECDQQGVVFNAHYLMYFDVALTELWREALGAYGDMLESGTDMVVAEARARYLASAGFDDEIDVEVRISRLGVTGMSTRMTVRRDSTVVVEGDMRHVFIDPATKVKKPIPDDIRGALSPYLEQEALPESEPQRSSTAAYSRSGGPV
jgi:acyl-CoA thioester hydrolase